MDMNLTTAQLDAIRRTGQDVCVVARRRSGKTAVLIKARFAWLVEERRPIADSRHHVCGKSGHRNQGAADQNVSRCAPGLQIRCRDAIEQAWVSTIDGFCMRVLRENAIAARLSRICGARSTFGGANGAGRGGRSSIRCFLSGLRNGDCWKRWIFRRTITRASLIWRGACSGHLRIHAYRGVAHELPETRVVSDIWPRAQNSRR